MDRTRWSLFAALLLVAFSASVAVGAWIGRQGGSGTPVAAVPTPTPGSASLPTITAPLVTPNPTAPTPTIAPATPSPTPAEASHGPSIPAPTQTPVLDPATSEIFSADLRAAFQSGDTTYLFERLAPPVLDRYGERQCRRRTNEFTADPSTNWTVVSSSGPADWSWESDGKATPIDDTWTVIVDVPGTGQREQHFVTVDGTWRWFLDCGDPH